MSAPLLEDVLDATIDTWLADVMVAQVAIVTAFDAETHSISARPISKKKQEREDGEIVHKEQPIIPNIPVYYMGSGDNRATFTIAKGSLVILLHLNQAKDAWLYSKGTGTVLVNDERRHHYTDCIAFAGVLTRGQTSEDNARVDAGWVFHTASKIKLGGGATEPVIRKPDLASAFEGLLTDDAVMGALAAYQAALAGLPLTSGALPGARTALAGAINTHMTNNTYGSDVVEAE